MNSKEKNEMKTSFYELQEAMDDFVRQRGPNWIHANSKTKNLILSAMIEMGELAEKFQWKSSGWVPSSEDEKTEVAYEIVDVFNYLFQLLSVCGIDFPAAYWGKMKKLEEKYPADGTDDTHEENKREYRRTGKNKLYK